MTESQGDDDDLVRLRPGRQPSWRRVVVDPDEPAPTLDAGEPTRKVVFDPSTDRGASSRKTLDLGEQREIVLHSAALLHGSDRIPIPQTGLTLGSAAEAGVTLRGAGVAPIQAAIEATAAGYVIVERGRRSETYVNGELLVAGERRPLRRGDAIALAGRLFHYLPAGQALPRLARVQAVDAGRIRASGRELLIGRDAACDIVLDHPTVSPQHALIRPRHGETTLEDLGSAIGTRINEIRVRRAPLDAGDQIAIGPFRIVYDGEELIQRDAPAGLAVVASEVQVDVDDGTILQPTTLHLRAGELVAIIGESGAGKSTLLKTLAGVSLPTRGNVMIGGEPVQARVSEIGYVPQFDIVHDELTVEEALDFAARLRLPGDAGAEARMARVCEVMAQLGLEERAGVRVRRLSGGQRKRVAVGIELLHRPGALFLDEPTTGLDPGLERHMTQLFRELAETGQTVALVTHATGSLALYDRVVVMGRGGVLSFDGTPDALLARFGVEHFDDVYSALASHIGPAVHVTTPALPPLQGRNERLVRPVSQALSYQTRVLATRYALLMSRDRKHLRNALLQVPVLALLTALLYPSGVFGRTPTEFAAKSAQLVFLMVTIAIWLGSINAAREIVKERNVLDRELAVGVQLPAYLLSKLVVLLAFVGAQVLLFALLVLVLRPLHEPAIVSYEYVGVLIMSGFVAVLLGLFVSARASSEDQATGVIPLLLIPQLLFSGSMVPAQDMTKPVEVISWFVPSRWSYAGAGDVIHLQDRIDSDPAFSPISHFGRHFFSVGPPTFILISLLFSVTLFAWITRRLRRPGVV